MSESKTDAAAIARQRSAPYPRYNLQLVEKFAKIVFDQGPRNCNQDVIAKKAGYSGAKNGSFFAMKSAANQFGFVVAKGDLISVSELWVRAFHEDTPSSLRLARQQAIMQPTLYKRLFEAFADHQLPPMDKLARTIHLDSRYGITKEAALEAVKIFKESAQYAEVLDDRGYFRVTTLDASADSVDGPDGADNSVEVPPPLRDPGTARGGSPAANTGTTQRLTQPPPAGDGMLAIPAGMEKQEFTFKGGNKAYFIVPVPLPTGEKGRFKRWLDLLKMHIDLTLEDDPEQPSHSESDDNNV